MPKMTKQEQADLITQTVTHMALLGDDDQWDASLKLRTAINNWFRGTSDASKAAEFVEQYVPEGRPLTCTAQGRLNALADAIVNNRIHTFSW